MSKATELPSIFWVKLAGLGASSALPEGAMALMAAIATKARQTARPPQAIELNRFMEKLRMREPCAEWNFRAFPVWMRLAFPSAGAESRC